MILLLFLCSFCSAFLPAFCFSLHIPVSASVRGMSFCLRLDPGFWQTTFPEFPILNAGIELSKGITDELPITARRLPIYTETPVIPRSMSFFLFCFHLSHPIRWSRELPEHAAFCSFFWFLFDLLFTIHRCFYPSKPFWLTPTHFPFLPAPAKVSLST